MNTARFRYSATGMDFHIAVTDPGCAGSYNITNKAFHYFLIFRILRIEIAAPAMVDNVQINVCSISVIMSNRTNAIRYFGFFLPAFFYRYLPTGMDLDSDTIFLRRVI